MTQIIPQNKNSIIKNKIGFNKCPNILGVHFKTQKVQRVVLGRCRRGHDVGVPPNPSSGTLSGLSLCGPSLLGLFGPKLHDKIPLDFFLLDLPVGGLGLS